MRWEQTMVTIEHTALVLSGIGILWWQNSLQRPSDVMVTAALVLIGLPGGHAAAVVLGGVRGVHEHASGSSPESSPPASPGESGSHGQGGGGDG